MHVWKPPLSQSRKLPLIPRAVTMQIKIALKAIETTKAVVKLSTIPPVYKRLRLLELHPLVTILLVVSSRLVAEPA